MKVNHLLIGAARSGSTSFCKHIENHPQVCFSSLKEIHYFSQPDLYDRGETYYHSFFNHYQNEKVIASADTYLMIDYKAIDRIYTYNPDMKILVILRNPVERAFSSFLYAKNYGYTKKNISFLDSIENEKDLLVKETSIIQLNNLAHFYCGLYHKHLMEWMKVFPKENFFITTTSELKNSPQNVMDKYCDFAQIEKMTVENLINLNPSAKARLLWLEQLLLNRDTGLRKLIRKYTPQQIKNWIMNSHMVDKLHMINRKNVTNEQITEEEKEVALSYFKEDIQKLKKHFGIHL